MVICRDCEGKEQRQCGGVLSFVCINKDSQDQMVR